VGGLGGGMNDEAGTELLNQRQDAIAVADIEGFVAIAGDFAAQPVEDPARIALGAEEDGAMVIVDSNNVETLAGEEDRDL